MAATNNKTCPVTTLQTLFIRNPQPRTTLFFHLTGHSTAFIRKLVIDIFQEHLRVHNIVTAKSYTGHSFRKSAAQYASNNGMLDYHIQKLGRWTSRVFQFYFETFVLSLYTLNMRFQTGRTSFFNQSALPTAPSLLE